MNIPRISQEMFFKVGVGVFLIIGVAKTILFITNLSTHTFLTGLIAVADIFFTLFLTVFFYSLLKSSGKFLDEFNYQEPDNIEGYLKGGENGETTFRKK